MEVDGLKLDTAKLDQLIRDLQPQAEAIVAKAAMQVQGEAATRAPVDTGALRNSIQADEHNGPLEWWVHDGVEYGIYQELGTSRMAAQPFMKPAVESVRKLWDDMWKALFSK